MAGTITPKPSLYCTFLDVIQMILDVSTERINFSQLANIVVRPYNLIESYIKQADAMIGMYLAEAYPTVTDWTTTPWASAPIVPIDPSTGVLVNTGSEGLLSVCPNATATTGAWLLNFTDAGNISDAKFTLFSFNHGMQGINLHPNVNNTSTNGYVTIESPAWVDNSDGQGGILIVKNDKFMFSTINVKPAIWMISVNLATAIALNSIYLGQSPVDSPYGAMFWNRAMYFLERIKDKKLSIDIGLEEFNLLLPTSVKYDIDENGNNNTQTMQDLYGSYRTS